MTEDVISVLAHGWLNHISAVSGAASTLKQHGGRLSIAHRNRMLEMMVQQAKHLEAALRDVLEP